MWTPGTYQVLAQYSPPDPSTQQRGQSTEPNRLSLRADHPLSQWRICHSWKLVFSYPGHPMGAQLLNRWYQKPRAEHGKELSILQLEILADVGNGGAKHEQSSQANGLLRSSQPLHFVMEENTMRISDLVKMQSLLGPERRMEGNSNLPRGAPSMCPHQKMSQDTVSSPPSLGKLGTG